MDLEQYFELTRQSAGIAHKLFTLIKSDQQLSGDQKTRLLLEAARLEARSYVITDFLTEIKKSV